MHRDDVTIAGQLKITFDPISPLIESKPKGRDGVFRRRRGSTSMPHDQGAISNGLAGLKYQEETRQKYEQIFQANLQARNDQSAGFITVDIVACPAADVWSERPL